MPLSAVGAVGKKERRILRAAGVGVLLWPVFAWVAARALIVQSPLSTSDAIVVLANASALDERTRRAAQLFLDGRTARILVTNENLRSRWSDLHQRNLYTYEWEVEELQRSGVPAHVIEVLHQPVGSTYEEALETKQYALQHGLNSVLIVTSAYHSRRSLWVFQEVFAGTAVKIGLESAAPGQETPQPWVWWLHRAGWKAVALEYPKMVYYWLRYRSASNPDNSRATITSTVIGQTKGGMTLSVTAPKSADKDEVVLVDVRRSTGVSRKPQSDGTASVVIEFGDGFTCNLLACGHAYRRAGTFTITVNARNGRGESAIPVAVAIIVSEIPEATGLNTENTSTQNLIDMTDPRGNSIYHISSTRYGDAPGNAAKLQNAIIRAAANNRYAEQEIVLPAGAVFAGPIALPAPVGDKYITIRSSNLGSLPASGNRVGPNHGSLMPTITAPSSTNATLAAMWTTTPAPAVPPHHYRLQGIHFRKDDETKYSAMLLSLGDLNWGQNRLTMLPHHFIVERCWFDGGASDTSQTNSGVRIAADYVSVVDSYSGEFRLIGSGVDTAAIHLAKGRGPYAIVNNTLIAGSENFFVGGQSAEINQATLSNATTVSATLSNVTNLEVDQNIALPVGGIYSPGQSTIVRSISGNNISFDPIAAAPDNGGTAEWAATPSFLEFRQNYLYKPLRWRAGDPAYVGLNIQIKNLWESKHSRYVVVDGNVLENSWIKDQYYAIAITPRKQWGSETVAAVTRELQFSNNIIKNVANGVMIAAADNNGPVQTSSDITFRNNLFQNVGANWDSSGAVHMLINMISEADGRGGRVNARRVFFIHNTDDGGMPDGNRGMITDFGGDGGALESMWLNNIHPHGGGGFRSSDSATDCEANIRKYLPPGDSTSWNRNVIVNKSNANYPRRGIYVRGPWPNQFVNYGAADFTLAPQNPGRAAATDGTDVGADMEALRRATAGVRSGSRTNSSPTRPRRVTDKGLR